MEKAVEINIIASISNIDIIDLKGKEFINYSNNLIFSKESPIVHFIVGKGSLKEHIGTIEFSNLLNRNTILNNSKILVKDINKRILSEETNKLSMNFLALGTILLNSLWFIKDNNCNLGTIYSLFPEFKDDVIRRDSTIVFSNSTCDFKKTKFTAKEIKSAIKIFNLILPLFTIDKKLLDNESPEKLSDGYSASEFNDINYNSFNRVSRALQFLESARTDLVLPSKISRYIGVYEVLFSTNPGDISHKISERCALYTSQDLDERLNIFSLIKKAYSVRSKYVHGQDLSKGTKDSSQLKDICKKIDDLTRKVLNKILVEDLELFTQDQERMDIWFKELVLNPKR